MVLRSYSPVVWFTRLTLSSHSPVLYPCFLADGAIAQLLKKQKSNLFLVSFCWQCLITNF